MPNSDDFITLLIFDRYYAVPYPLDASAT